MSWLKRAGSTSPVRPSTGEPYDFHIGPQQIYYPNGQCSQSNEYNHGYNRQCNSGDGHDQTYWYNNAYQCTSGGWTGFDSGKSDDNSIKNFITKLNPNKLKDDADGRPSSVNKSSSTTQSLYDAVNSCSASGDKSCEYMMIPILDTSSTPSGNSGKPYYRIRLRAYRIGGSEPRLCSYANGGAGQQG